MKTLTHVTGPLIPKTGSATTAGLPDKLKKDPVVPTDTPTAPGAVQKPILTQKLAKDDPLVVLAEAANAVFAKNTTTGTVFAKVGKFEKDFNAVKDIGPLAMTAALALADEYATEMATMTPDKVDIDVNVNSWVPKETGDDGLKVASVFGRMARAIAQKGLGVAAGKPSAYRDIQEMVRDVANATGGANKLALIDAYAEEIETPGLDPSEKGDVHHYVLVDTSNGRYISFFVMEGGAKPTDTPTEPTEPTEPPVVPTEPTVPTAPTPDTTAPTTGAQTLVDVQADPMRKFVFNTLHQDIAPGMDDEAFLKWLGTAKGLKRSVEAYDALVNRSSGPFKTMLDDAEPALKQLLDGAAKASGEPGASQA